MYSCLCLNQHWASLCPTRQHQLQYPPNFRCSPRSVHFSCALRATTLSKVVWHTFRFFHLSPGLYQLERWIQLDSCHHAKTPRLHLVLFNFLGNLFSRAQTGLIQHQMLSHLLRCSFVHVNCPSDTITYAFTGSCRVLLTIFVPLSKSDAWVW